MSGTRDNNFVKWKGTFWSDRPDRIQSGSVKLDYLQRSQIPPSERSEMIRSNRFQTEISGDLGFITSIGRFIALSVWTYYLGKHL